MTEGLDFRPLPSKKFPLPLTSAMLPGRPNARTIRADVQSRMDRYPVGVLGGVLALLELYESNQPDIAEYFLEDMPFVRACFASKRCNGWISLLGGGDREGLEGTINERWQFRFFSGPPRPTGVYVLLNMLARYAFVYGPIAPGDAHELGHFVEDLCPGLLVCRDPMSDLARTLSLAAMKMGVPAVVPENYPFPLGRSIRADTPKDIADAVVGFANIRRLLETPDIPPLPSYCDPENASQDIAPAVTWGGNESFFLVRKGRVDSPGSCVSGAPGRDIGVVVTINAEPMDAFDCAHVEQAIAAAPAMIDGVAVTRSGQEFCIHQADGVSLDPRRLGEVFAAAAGNRFPRLKDAVFVEIIFETARLAEMAPRIRAEKQARSREIAAATEESVDWFVGCTGCSPFAPDHVCIITPQRLPQCGRSIGALKAGALYAYDDMSNIHHSRLQQGANSFLVIDKGQCLDALRGEWSGVNEHAARMTDGRTRRVQLHCLDETPHTGCGCFRLILFQTDFPRPGVGVMDRSYEGCCGDGRAWKDLYYQQAGKQSVGTTGAGLEYVRSAKFLQAHGGWDGVVWVSPKVAEFMGEQLPGHVVVGEDSPPT